MFIDNPKNNIIAIIFVILIIFIIIFLGGRFSHEMHDKWQILFL